MPDVVFVSCVLRRGRPTPPRAGCGRSSGRDGSEIWSVTDPALGLNGSTKPAAADIDGDGRPEIVVGAEDNEHAARVRARRQLQVAQRRPRRQPLDWGGPAIADLDADGVPEIVIGRQVLTNQGRLRWTGAGPSRGGDHGANSIVVDLDLDGRPEVVAGNTAYVGQGPSQGQILWRNTTSTGGAAIQDGYAAAGNFDADPNPEIVLVSRGWVLLLEHDGRVKWGPTHTDPSLPGSGRGRRRWPTSTGTGRWRWRSPGTGTSVVFEADGSLKWRAPIEDTTTATGSVAFDFDGDGAAELVYGDHIDVRIFRGSDGVILFRDRTASGTGERVAGRGRRGRRRRGRDRRRDRQLVGRRPIPGVRVYGEATGPWAEGAPALEPVRLQRQQHRRRRPRARCTRAAISRSVTAGPRPLAEGRRAHAVCAFPQPDLTASALRITDTPSEWELVVRIGNGGARVVGPDLPVSFYDGDPRLGARKLGTVATTRYLHPGEYEDVTLRLPRSTTTRAAVFASADDAGGLKGRILESDEQNNVLDGGRALVAAAGLPDLTVVDVDVSGLVANPKTLALSGVASARIRNQSELPVAASLDVAFFEDRDGDGVLGAADVVLGQVTVSGLGPLETLTVEAPVSGSLSFLGSPVRAFVDAASAVAESDETNNVGRAGEACQVRPAGPPFTLREEWAWTTASVLSTPVVGDLERRRSRRRGVRQPATASTTTDGQLRAVSGRSGQPLFSVLDPANELNPVGDPGDRRHRRRRPARDRRCRRAGQPAPRLRARRHAQVAERRCSSTPSATGAPFLADLDRDGRAEIVVGRQVLNGNGTLRWTGSAPMAGPHAGHGPALRRRRPRPRRHARGHRRRVGLSGGRHAAVVGAGGRRRRRRRRQPRLRPLPRDRGGGHGGSGSSSTTAASAGARWSSPARATSARSRSPTSTATRSRRSASANGRPTTSSRRTASCAGAPPPRHRRSCPATASAFDFDGDGAAELVLADPAGLHVLRGRDGSVAGELPAGSCSNAYAYPVVADVDGDGKAEIVMGSYPCAGSPATGVRAFGEARDGWVRARAAWSQFEYTVPGENTWRANAAAPGASPFAAADLTASFVRRSESGSDLVLTARIGNAGVGTVNAGVPVSAYNGDPRLGYPFLVTTADDAPARARRVRRRGPPHPERPGGAGSLFVAADDAGDQLGTIGECDEENNRHDTGLFLNQPPTVERRPGPHDVAAERDAVALGRGRGRRPAARRGPERALVLRRAARPGLVPQLFSDPSSPTTTSLPPSRGRTCSGSTSRTRGSRAAISWR